MIIIVTGMADLSARTATATEKSATTVKVSAGGVAVNRLNVQNSGVGVSLVPDDFVGVIGVSVQSNSTGMTVS